MTDIDLPRMFDPETDEALASLDASLDAPNAEDLAAEDVQTRTIEQRIVLPGGEVATVSHEVVDR
jgi:hypothetical protein